MVEGKYIIYPKKQGNSVANSGALYVERHAELINVSHDLLVALADLYVVLQQTGADFTSGTRDLRHHGGFDLHHHLSQV